MTRAEKPNAVSMSDDWQETALLQADEVVRLNEEQREIAVEAIARAIKKVKAGE